jgi:hypothetical protein
MEGDPRQASRHHVLLEPDGKEAVAADVLEKVRSSAGVQTARSGPDAIRWWKDASLVERLDRLHSEWLSRGRPTLGDYRVAFVSIEDDASVPPGGWVLDRRFFRQLVWLQRS